MRAVLLDALAAPNACFATSNPKADGCQVLILYLGLCLILTLIVMTELQSSAMQKFQARLGTTSRALLARARAKPTGQMGPALPQPPQ